MPNDITLPPAERDHDGALETASKPGAYYLHARPEVLELVPLTAYKVFDVVHDAISFEFAGSELYVRDIPLWIDGRSSLAPDNCHFSKEEMDRFAKEAMRVNQNRRSGRAAFFFRAV